MAEDIPIVDIASSGVVKDTPAVSLANNIFTDVRNVIFKDGAIRKIKGEVLLNNITSDLSSPLSFGKVRYFATWENPNIQPSGCYYIWVVDLLNSGTIVGQKVYIQDQVGNKRDITPTTFNSGNGFTFTTTGWQHTLFTGGFVFIINNGIEKPHYILDTPGNTNINNITLQELPGWDSYNSAEVKVDKQWFTGDGSYFDLGMKVDFSTHTIEVTGQRDKVATVSTNHAGTNTPNAANYVPPNKNTSQAVVGGTNTGAPHQFFIFTDTSSNTTTIYVNGLAYGEQVIIKLRSRNTITVRAGVIKSFGNLLVAGDLTELDGTTITRRLAGVIRTSDVAAPGSVPGNWNPFSAGVNTADEFTLSETNIIKDMLQLQGNMYIYTNHSIHAMTLTGNELAPISFATITDQYGCLSQGSIIEFDGKHFVTSDSDIYLFSGNPGTIQSISDARIRSYFIDNLSATYRDQTFVMGHHKENEIWLCYPTLDTVLGECDEALIYNYRDNTWTIRDLDRVFGGDIGPIRGGGVPIAKLYLSGNSGNFGYTNLGATETQKLTFKHPGGTNPPFNPTTAQKGYWPKPHLGYKESNLITIFLNSSVNGQFLSYNTGSRQRLGIDFDALTVAPSVVNAEVKIDLSFGGAATYKLGGTETPPHSSVWPNYTDELRLLRFDGYQSNPYFIQSHENTNHTATQPEGLTGSGFYIRLKYKQLQAGSSTLWEYKQSTISALTLRNSFNLYNYDGGSFGMIDNNHEYSREHLVRALVSYINSTGTYSDPDFNGDSWTASVITDFDETVNWGGTIGTKNYSGLGLKIVSNDPGVRQFVGMTGADLVAYSIWNDTSGWHDPTGANGSNTGVMYNTVSPGASSMPTNGFMYNSVAGVGVYGVSTANSPSMSLKISNPADYGADAISETIDLTGVDNASLQTVKDNIAEKIKAISGNTFNGDNNANPGTKGKFYVATIADSKGIESSHVDAAANPIKIQSELAGGGTTSGSNAWNLQSGAGYNDFTVELVTLADPGTGTVVEYPATQFGGTVTNFSFQNFAGFQANSAVDINGNPTLPIEYTLTFPDGTSQSWIGASGSWEASGTFYDSEAIQDKVIELIVANSDWTKTADAYDFNVKRTVTCEYHSIGPVTGQFSLTATPQTSTGYYTAGAMPANWTADRLATETIVEGFDASPTTDELVVTPPSGFGSPITINFDSDGTYDPTAASGATSIPAFEPGYVLNKIKTAFQAQQGFSDHWTINHTFPSGTDEHIYFQYISRQTIPTLFSWSTNTQGNARAAFETNKDPNTAFVGTNGTGFDAYSRANWHRLLPTTGSATDDASGVVTGRWVTGTSPAYARGTRVTVTTNASGVVFDKHYGEGPGRILDPTFTPAANDNHYGSVTHYGSNNQTALPNVRNSTNDAAYLALFFSSTNFNAGYSNGLSVDLGEHQALQNQANTNIGLDPTNALKEILDALNTDNTLVLTSDSGTDPTWIEITPTQFGDDSNFVNAFSPLVEVVSSTVAPTAAYVLANNSSLPIGSNHPTTAPTFVTTGTLLGSGINIERPWSISAVNPNKKFPIFVESNTANDGTITNWIRSADVGYDFDGTNYTSYFEREQLSITPTFDTEYVSGLALWAEGGTVTSWGDDPQRATLQVRCRATNYPGEEPYLTIPEDNTKSNAKANALIINDFTVASDYKVDLKTTGRLINIRVDDASVDYTTSPNNKAWTIAGMHLTVGKKGVR